jgi:hypothetical protein
MQQGLEEASADKDTMTNYPLTGGRTLTGGRMYRLEPQLAAVVLVLAAYSRCSPSELMDCVTTLERQLVAVESGVGIIRRLQQQQQQRQRQPREVA